MRLKPFFSYYGSKHRIARLYPEPQTGRIIDCCCGSAAYPLLHFRRKVLLTDANPRVAGVWDFLIRASVAEIRTLPVLANGEGVDALNVPQEAKWLIGFNLARGRAHPAKTPSAWRTDQWKSSHFWGEAIRERIARQVPFIRHWKVRCANYWEAPDVEADWFFDPPYQGRAGRQYRRFGSDNFDYEAAGRWAQERRGQVIACENVGATWLPFQPFRRATGMQGANRTGVSHEAIWHRPLYSTQQADLFAA